MGVHDHAKAPGRAARGEFDHQPLGIATSIAAFHDTREATAKPIAVDSAGASNPTKPVISSSMVCLLCLL